jgi:hypothetical protein
MGNPTASPTISSSTTPIPSPSSSTGPTLSDQLNDWFVIVFIASVIVVACARLVLMIIGYKKESTSKSAILS